MTRIVLVSVVLLAFAALALGGALASADAPQAVVLRVGDTMTVENADIGCQVIERDGRPVIDCRRAGRHKGTYMTLFDDRRVRVARFRSQDTAKVIFTAKHHGKARRCGDKARSARK
jgi:hypothetical protein